MASTTPIRQDPTAALTGVFGRTDIAATFDILRGGTVPEPGALDGLDAVPGRCDRDVMLDTSLDDATRFAAKVRLGLAGV